MLIYGARCMSKASILIVEDEQIVVLDIHNTLEKYGFSVAGYANRGEDAIKKAGEIYPDLILMDIGLKGEVDGIEAAKQIRKLFDLPVIFLTAFGNQATVQRASQAEPFGYIFKPFEARELVGNIEMALYKHGMEKKLRENERKFRSVVEQASDGIALVDSHGNIIEWNPTMEQITGLARSEVLDRPIWEITFQVLPKEEKTAITRDAHALIWDTVIKKGFTDKEEIVDRVIETSQGMRRIVQSNGFTFETSKGLHAGVIMRDITEQKRVEDELREVERRFRHMLENVQLLAVMLDMRGNITFCNNYLLEMTGWQREEIAGKNWFDLFVPPQLGLKDMFEESFVKGIFPPHFENETLTRSGEHRLVAWNNTMLRDLQGKVIGTASIGEDITDRKRAEAVLRESEEQYRRLVEGTPDVVYTFSTKRGGIYYSSRVKQMLGYSAEYLYTQPFLWNESIYAEDRNQISDALREFKLGKNFDIEYRIQDAHGNWHWLRDRSIGGHVEEDEMLIEGVAIDITERKRAEVELRKLSQAVEQSANAIVITDVEGNIEYANPKFFEVSGYSLAEVMNKNPRILKSGDHSREFYQNLWQTIKAGKVWRGEIHNRRKDGTLYWEDSTITPVFDSARKLINFIAVKEDITARKMLEEAERDQRQLAEALRDTAAALNGTLKLDEVLDRVLENIGKLVICDTAMILLLDGYLVRKIRHRSNTTQGTLPQMITSNTQLNLVNAPILDWMRETKQPCLIPDTQADPRWRTIPGMDWIRSFVSAPIEIRGHVEGLIHILSAKPGFFTPFHSERLIAFAGQAAVAIANAQLFEQAYYLSITDPLTELNNRRHFFEIAKFEFDRIHRYKRTLSIMMIDIDHFKKINDIYGHAVGDLALREIATRINHSVRTVDIVARYGGEEFIVLMPETGLKAARQVAERVRKSLADKPIEAGSVTVFATLSIGVAEIDEKSKNVDQLIIYADRALYMAKETGRNRVAGYQKS